MRPRAARGGSALVVALWALLLLALLVGSFAFDMRVEAGIASHYRKRVKADYLARAGLEWARLALARSATVREGEPGEDPELYLAALHVSRGLAVRGFRRALGEGAFAVEIEPEEDRRNVNLLTDDEWMEVLDQGGVPEDRWNELIDNFRDWTDPDEEHRLNGAESDDPWYEERGYKVRNAPLDLVEELTLIKGFTAAIVHGGPGESPDDPPLPGIAQHLTTWGDGHVNVNGAPAEVLLTLVGIADWDVDAIMQGRLGADAVGGTEDDGFRNVEEAVSLAGLDPAVRERLTVAVQRHVRVRSVGEVGRVTRTLTCVLALGDGGAVPVFWREEPAR